MKDSAVAREWLEASARTAKETDGKWRVFQERILPRDEAEHDGLWQRIGPA